MDNIINGLEYQLETGSDAQEEEDYDEDDFENYQDKSDDEQTLETPKNSQRNTMKQSLFDSKLKINLEQGNSPQRINKDRKESKYYHDLEESHQLKVKQDEIDPLKEFYDMRENRTGKD